MSLLALIPAALQAGVGIAQYLGGQKQSKQATPDYTIPSEYLSMMNTQKNYMLGDMPSSTKIRQDIRGNTSDYIDNAARYGIIDPNTASAAYGSEQDALGNLGVQNAQYRVGEKDKYLNTLGMMGQQKDLKQQWEVMTPFERTMQTASAMMGAGMQNAWGAVSSAGDYFGAKDMYDKSSNNMMLPKGF